MERSGDVYAPLLGSWHYRAPTLCKRRYTNQKLLSALAFKRHDFDLYSINGAEGFRGNHLLRRSNISEAATMQHRHTLGAEKRLVRIVGDKITAMPRPASVLISDSTRT